MNSRSLAPHRFFCRFHASDTTGALPRGRRRHRMIRMPEGLVRTEPFGGGVSLVAALLGAPPSVVQAQIRAQRWTRNEDGRHFSMSVRGKVWFTDDDRDVERIEPDGRLMLEEKWRGGPD